MHGLHKMRAIAIDNFIVAASVSPILLVSKRLQIPVPGTNYFLLPRSDD